MLDSLTLKYLMAGFISIVAKPSANPCWHYVIASIIQRDPPWPSGYDAWLPSVRSQVRVSVGSLSGLAWSLYKRVAFWRTVYGPSATERPLGTILEE